MNLKIPEAFEFFVKTELLKCKRDKNPNIFWTNTSVYHYTLDHQSSSFEVFFTFGGK